LCFIKSGIRFGFDTLTQNQISDKQILNISLKFSAKISSEPILPTLNKDVVQALATHAQQIAKVALDQIGAGLSLVNDVKVSKLFTFIYYND
jgi:hypothetical protein